MNKVNVINVIMCVIFRLSQSAEESQGRGSSSSAASATLGPCRREGVLIPPSVDPRALPPRPPGVGPLLIVPGARPRGGAAAGAEQPHHSAGTTGEQKGLSRGWSRRI